MPKCRVQVEATSQYTVEHRSHIEKGHGELGCDNGYAMEDH